MNQRCDDRCKQTEKRQHNADGIHADCSPEVKHDDAIATLADGEHFEQPDRSLVIKVILSTDGGLNVSPDQEHRDCGRQAIKAEPLPPSALQPTRQPA